LGVRGEYVVPARVGAEAGVVGSFVAQGRGFMSPFDGGMSASTHLPPLYPVLLAGLIKVQWVVGMAPADGPARAGAFVFYAALLINLVASALLPLVALRIAEAAGFPVGVGRLAAVMLCFCPEALRAVGLVWDEALFATLCGAWVLLVLKDAGREFRWGYPLRAGVAAGVVSLLNPAVVVASVVAWVALNWPGRKATTEAQRHGGFTEKGERNGMGDGGAAQDRGGEEAGNVGTPRCGVAKLGAGVVGMRSWMRFGVGVMVLVGGMLAAEIPWHVRNWVWLEPPARVFVRGNFWLECWTNLNPLKPVATGVGGGTRWAGVHPWQGTEALVRDGRVLTEQEYFAWCKERVLGSEEFSEPGRMTVHIMKNLGDFWVGYYEALRWHKSVLMFAVAQGIPALLAGLGLALARGRMGGRMWWAMVGMLVVFGLPYYVSGAAARYRHPLDLAIYLMAAWGLWRAAGKVGGGRWGMGSYKE
jgi:hypothetical protein